MLNVFLKLNSIPGLEAEEPKKRIETPTTDVAAAEELPESQEVSVFVIVELIFGLISKAVSSLQL